MVPGPAVGGAPGLRPLHRAAHDHAMPRSTALPDPHRHRTDAAVPHGIGTAARADHIRAARERRHATVAAARS